MLLVIIFSLFTLIASAQNDICGLSTPDKADVFQSKEFIVTQKSIDDKIMVFANSKEVATLADAMLSQLLRAKSPVITSWMKTRNLESQSEDEIVRRWRDYFARNFILSKYPHKEVEINGRIEKLLEELSKQHFPTEFRKRIQLLFQKVLKLSVAKINSWPMDSDVRVSLTQKISKISLHWLDKFTDSHFKSFPVEFLSWGAAYDPKFNSINMGLNVLAYANEETLLSVLAHEIGHAIDSCRWSSDNKSKPWPFQKVGECLRSAEGVNAKMRDDSRLKEELKSGRLSPELSQFLKDNPTCNNSIYPPIGTQADQLPEAFADWFSAEVISQNETITNSFRSDLCQDKKLNSGSTYVENKDRLERIYLANPIIKNKLGLKASVTTARTYCQYK